MCTVCTVNLREVLSTLLCFVLVVNVGSSLLSWIASVIIFLLCLITLGLMQAWMANEHSTETSTTAVSRLTFTTRDPARKEQPASVGLTGVGCTRGIRPTSVATEADRSTISSTGLLPSKIKRYLSSAGGFSLTGLPG